ncbi:MAG: YicC family protein [Synergistales bacterium]|nr:YicC family protein [Synergistales bacterium]
MITSMTGFGSATRDETWGTLHIEISSVNHRYQEVTVRLPRELSSLEQALQRQAKAAFRRGKMTVRVEMQWSPLQQTVEINEEVLKRYYAHIERLKSKLHIIEDVRLDLLLNMPGVMEEAAGRDRTVTDAVETALAETADEALRGWNAMRRQEGEHLQEDIASHAGTFSALLDSIDGEWPKAKRDAYSRMVERLQQFVEESGTGIDQSRLAQEAAVLSDKWDIAEELSRSRSHLQQFHQLFNETEPVGRKMDFLTQEMNREINTISSKVAESRIRWLAVEAKAALERIREQVQNVE